MTRESTSPAFAILGEVAATLAGHTITIRSVRKRLILAMLLSRTGTRVSSDCLIDALWGAAPPPTAHENLRVYLYKLRKDLGSRHGIAYEGGGYRLLHERGRLDAEVFQEWAGQGKDAAARGDVVTASRLLRRSLALWRGKAYGDLGDHPALRDDAHRLEEHRLAVLQARIEADLALGAHADLVPELVKLVNELPFHEDLRAQLMLALYRSGRQRDALETYRDAVRILSRELAVQPGHQLQQLHEAILNEDPRLDPTSAAPAVRELPPDIGYFTGRETEVERLVATLSTGGNRLTAISGPGGAGKSALAVHVAHRIADHYPDGQLYIDLHGSTIGIEPLKTCEALARFLRSLGVNSSAPSETEEAAARFRSLTANRRYLIVLDNALDVAQVRPLLPSSATCAVIVTSRKILGSLDGATHCEIDTLPPQDAGRAFRLLVGRRADAEPAAVREVVSRCGHLPLAVCIAAARLVMRPAWTVSTLADLLAKEEDRLSELRNDDRTVKASFAVSYRELHSAAARAFRLVGLLECRDIGAPPVAAMLCLPEPRAERLLDDLLDARLLNTSTRGRYHMHDLVRLFAREQAMAGEPAPSRAAAVRRALHHYLATARAASALVIPMAPWRTTIGSPPAGDHAVELGDRESVFAWIDAEAGNLPTVVRQAVSAGDDDIAVGLAAALFFPLYDRGRWRELLVISGLGAGASDRLGDPHSRAIIHGDLGYAQADHGMHDQAVEHLRQSLAEFRRIGNRRGEAAQLDRLGVVRSRQGRYDEAIAYFRSSLELESGRGNRFGEAITLTNLGITHRRAGHFDQALESHLASLAIHREIEDEVGQAAALGDTAETYRRANRLEDATACYRQALEQDGVSGNQGTYIEAVHWWGLGMTMTDLGEEATALECRRRSANILHGLCLITAEERARIGSGRVHDVPQIIARNL